MGWTPAQVEWAKASPTQISDAHVLAYSMFSDPERTSPWFGGIATTMAWVRGGRPAPVTERTETPVTQDLATAEMWSANAAMDEPGMPPLPLDSACAGLSVPARAPLPVHPRFAHGTWRTLRWLLGVQDQQPPMPLPVRHADGSIPTADELYDLAIGAAPHRSWLPEQRHELRTRVEANAREYRTLASIIDETLRGVAG